MKEFEVDHIIYCSPELNSGQESIEQLLEVQMQPGGVHDGRGTHNSLLGLDEQIYFEVIAPDPNQSGAEKPLWMGIDQIQKPSILSWALKSSDLEADFKLFQTWGWEMGGIAAGSRALPDGNQLNWRLTEPNTNSELGFIPFLIQWPEAFHPTDLLIRVGKLHAVYVTVPHDLRIPPIELKNVKLIWERGEVGALEVEIMTERGIVRVR